MPLSIQILLHQNDTRVQHVEAGCIASALSACGQDRTATINVGWVLSNRRRRGNQSFF